MTTIAAPVEEQAASAEARFLEAVRRRVAWQAERAAAQREQARAPKEPLDLLDVDVLVRLVSTGPTSSRTAEWTAFVGELLELVDDDGRLPDTLERLVRVVLADLI